VAYKQCKKNKKDKEETLFFGLLWTNKFGAIYIYIIHNAIDDEEKREANEPDDEQEDCILSFNEYCLAHLCVISKIRLG
jgi:hypothetical protein